MLLRFFCGRGKGGGGGGSYKPGQTCRIVATRVWRCMPKQILVCCFVSVLGRLWQQCSGSLVCVCVCVCRLNYPVWQAHAPYCIVFCGLFGPTAICSTLSHKRHDFRKKSYWTQNVCFDFLHNFCLKHFSLQEELNEILLKMYIGLHVKYRLLLLDLNEIWIFWTDFR